MVKPWPLRRRIGGKIFELEQVFTRKADAKEFARTILARARVVTSAKPRPPAITGSVHLLAIPSRKGRYAVYARPLPGGSFREIRGVL